MKIDRVTFTGVDDNTKIEDLRDLATEYSTSQFCIEYGVLFSPNNGRVRYPSFTWIKELLLFRLKNNLDLSGHLCGKYSQEVLNGKDSLIKNLAYCFNRFQINFNFTKNKNFDLTSFYYLVNNYPKSRFILQYNASNKEIIEEIIEAIYKQIIGNNIHFLYDASGGRGVFSHTETIPPIDNFYTGYSGGLSQLNIGEVGRSIINLPQDRRVWVDMESGIRDENDEFDIEKCTQVLEILTNINK